MLFHRVQKHCTAGPEVPRNAVAGQERRVSAAKAGACRKWGDHGDPGHLKELPAPGKEAAASRENNMSTEVERG